MTTATATAPDAARAAGWAGSRNLADPHTVPRHGPYAAAEWVVGDRRWRRCSPSTRCR